MINTSPSPNQPSQPVTTQPSVQQTARQTPLSRQQQSASAQPQANFQQRLGAQSQPNSSSQVSAKFSPTNFLKSSKLNFSASNLKSAFSTAWLPKFILVVVLLTVIYFAPKMFGAKATITVVGQGTYDFAPDTVSMVVSLVTTGSDPAQTIDNGDASLKVLIDTAKSVAGSDVEIKKAFYQAQPIVGVSTANFQVVNAFSLVFKQVDKTSEMIKTLYDSGATTVSNVMFSAEDADKLTQEARKLAVKDAKAKAKDLAHASGKRLGKLITIADDNQEAAGTVTSVAKDDANLSNVAVTKNVSVVYEMW